MDQFFLFKQADQMMTDFAKAFKKSKGLDIIDQDTMMRFCISHNCKNNTMHFSFDNKIVFKIDYSDNTLNATIL